MMKIEEANPQKTKTHQSKMVKPITSLARPENDELDALQYIDHTCYNAPGDTTSGKDMIKIPYFDSGTPEEWIDLVQKQNLTLFHKCTSSWKEC